MILRKIKLNSPGFSLIEVLVVVFIAGVIFTSFYSVSMVGTRYIIESKNKLGAIAFANEKMEIARNLTYDKVGTVGSVDVPGNIPPEEEVVANGRSYTVSTSVHYFDDPMDGVAPADLIQNDYKIVRVVVSWNDSKGQTQSVSSSSRFVPTGLETSVGGSPLSINVSDGDTLLPVSNVSVHITNNSVSPAINDTIVTDSNGHIMLPAARVSDGNHLSITKGGYETITTLDSSATFTPIYGHVSIAAGFLNTYNYFQSKFASLKIKTADYQNNSIGSIGFSIGGGKILGHDEFNNNVFSMANTVATTDAVSGEKEYSNISAGNYTIVVSANAQYEFIDYDPSMSPVFLSAGSDATYTLRMADEDASALFVEVKDADISHAPIAGAKVTLTDAGSDIFSDKLSSLRGVVFYPDGAAALENKEYNLKVTADGYIENSQLITIDKLTHIVVDLTRN
jgi:prepilin-type N-terminal cleavage/methylation domain-containing protein